MRILILSFYCPPDLSAGSFRLGGLLEALKPRLGPGDSVRIITTQPNRYSSFHAEAPEIETQGSVTIERIRLPKHSSGFVDQSRAFTTFAREARRRSAGEKADLVFATSSRLMTAALGAAIAKRIKAPLYLDIRDLFVDTMQNVLTGPVKLSMPAFDVIERWTFRRADRINVVSPGFIDHISSLRGRNDLTVHTNGVDPEFTARTFEGGGNTPPVILYAGNVGEGQGLERIIPQAARLLSGRYRFKVVGDGGGKERLARALDSHGTEKSDVEIAPPVNRDRLMDEYAAADILFLHLNSHPAFEKVIPSKLFEYAATGKPVLAGVQGTARQFVREHIPNAATFDPCDAAGLERALGELTLQPTDRSEFVAKFARSAIMARMADDVLECARGRPGSRPPAPATRQD